jgi:hypothetical protein
VKLLIFVLAILLLAVTLGYSTPVPVLSVKGLVDSADEIVVGKIERVRQTGSGEIDYNGVKYARSDYKADINVDETIKGEPIPHKFVLSFSTPASDPWGNVAEGHLEPNTYRVIFRNKTSSGYRLASPYYPPVPQRAERIGKCNWVKMLTTRCGHVSIELLSSTSTAIRDVAANTESWKKRRCGLVHPWRQNRKTWNTVWSSRPSTYSSPRSTRRS